MTNQKELCLIIPCYNEEGRLNINSFKQAFSNYLNVEFLFVNDGSLDKTAHLLNNLENSFENVSFLDLKQTVGKAHAIREAVNSLEVDYKYIGFFDADLATPLSEVQNFLEKLNSNPHILCIMGARILRLGAPIKRKAYRHYLGRVFATIVSMMLKLPVYDTQCGAKIFKGSIAKNIFTDGFVSMWFFDVELIFRILSTIKKEEYLTSFYELPLTNWEDVAGSKLKFTDFLKTPLELIKIYRKYC